MAESNPSASPAVPTAPAKLPTPPPSQSGPEKDVKASAPSNAAPRASTSADADAPTTPPFSPSSTTPVLEKDPELDFTGNVDVNNDIPTDKDIKKVEDMLILDAKGQSRPFKDLYQGKGVASRQLIIFIRHFFCGNCQEYLRELSASISPESLLTLPEPTFITVIGCGRPDLIDMYTSETACPFPLYADPTRKLYDVLGMTRTLELGKKPNYIQSNLFVTSVQSIIQGLKTGSNALKGGDYKQVGGEFLFEDGKCVWAHRMRNTRDHAEIETLREVLGLEEKKPVIRKRWSHGIKTVKEKEKEGKGRSASWGRGRSKSKGAKDKDSLEIKTGRTSEEVKIPGTVEEVKTPELVPEDSEAKKTLAA